MSKNNLVILCFLFLSTYSFAALSRTYPTSNVTTVRMSAYTDGINTVGLSTDAIKVDDWDVVGSTWSYIPSNQDIHGYWSVNVGTNWVSIPVQWTIKEYTDLIYEESVLRQLNKVADDDIELYMVFPATFAPVGWRGWCLNNAPKPIPTQCP